MKPTMISLYLFSKKIHRLMLLLVSFLIILMAITGTQMKYSISLGLDLGMVRYIHSQISVLFTIVLFIMMISGLLMYFLPYIKQRQTVKQTNEQNQIN